jgi:hypothetical protein
MAVIGLLGECSRSERGSQLWLKLKSEESEESGEEC